MRWIILLILYPVLSPLLALSQPTITLESTYPSLAFDQPLDLIAYPGDPNKLIVIERTGLVKVVAGAGSSATSSTLIDLTSKIQSASDEQGLLSFAFHPRFTRNGLVFLSYTAKPDGRSVLSRMRISGSSVVSNSERRILSVAQPFVNHNGGKIAFARDGYLYFSLGDGGSAGDPLDNGEDRTKLLGKILRIDINRNSGSRRYSIPSDNPYASSSRFKREIWAYGFRNVWRFSFDRSTGRLWAGDVGQGAVEEIDIVRRGKNYGWNTTEGSQCYSPSIGCSKRGITPPVFEYTHSAGDRSITGGFVYRGTAIPDLVGWYVYGDFISGRIWALKKVDGSYQNIELLDTSLNIASFGQDKSGELYVVDYSGSIYGIKP